MSRDKGTDLDAPDSPDDVPHVLRNAADRMRAQAADLAASWQDKGAGRPWQMIAAELDRAAKRIEGRL